MRRISPLSKEARLRRNIHRARNKYIKTNTSMAYSQQDYSIRDRRNRQFERYQKLSWDYIDTYGEAQFYRKVWDYT